MRERKRKYYQELFKSVSSLIQSEYKQWKGSMNIHATSIYKDPNVAKSCPTSMTNMLSPQLSHKRFRGL